MRTLIDTLFGQVQKKTSEKTRVILPVNPEKAQRIIEGLDGTTEKILLAIETGKFEVWAKMAKTISIYGEKPTTQIGEHKIPGSYKHVGYTSSE